MKQVAGTLRLDLAQYRELAAFTQFGSDLDDATKATLDRGARLNEILKQPQYAPVPVEEQIVVFYFATRGYAEKFAVKDIVTVAEALRKYFRELHADVLNMIVTEKKLTDEITAKISSAIESFIASYQA